MVAPALESVIQRQVSRGGVASKTVRREAAQVTRKQWAQHKGMLLPLVTPFAGLSSAALEISLLFPMEYAKTQLQLNRNKPDFSLFAHFKSRGFSIYQGLPPMLIGAPIQGLLRFTCLDYCNQLMKDPVTGKTSPAAGLVAGVAAGVLESVLVVTPMETVKTRLIDSKKGLVDGVTHIVQTKGVSGLYKGVVPTIMKSSTNQGLRFIIFNQYKNLAMDPETQKLSASQSLIGGMTAGILGALINTPVDTIKSRMQSIDACRYKGVMDCAKTMIKEEGVLSLWKGLVMRWARVVPGQGIIFMSYEQISMKLRKTLNE